MSVRGCDGITALIAVSIEHAQKWCCTCSAQESRNRVGSEDSIYRYRGSVQDLIAIEKGYGGGPEADRGANP